MIGATPGEQSDEFGPTDAIRHVAGLGNEDYDPDVARAKQRPGRRAAPIYVSPPRPNVVETVFAARAALMRVSEDDELGNAMLDLLSALELAARREDVEMLKKLARQVEPYLLAPQSGEVEAEEEFGKEVRARGLAAWGTIERSPMAKRGTLIRRPKVSLAVEQERSLQKLDAVLDRWSKHECRLTDISLEIALGLLHGRMKEKLARLGVRFDADWFAQFRFFDEKLEQLETTARGKRGGIGRHTSVSLLQLAAEWLGVPHEKVRDLFKAAARAKQRSADST